MPCRKCTSGSQRSFKSEMTIAFREAENVNQSPLYVSQDISVCMDCGHIELALPAEKLAQKGGAAGGFAPARCWGRFGGFVI